MQRGSVLHTSAVELRAVDYVHLLLSFLSFPGAVVDWKNSIGKPNKNNYLLASQKMSSRKQSDTSSGVVGWLELDECGVCVARIVNTAPFLFRPVSGTNNLSANDGVRSINAAL